MRQRMYWKGPDIGTWEGDARMCRGSRGGPKALRQSDTTSPVAAQRGRPGSRRDAWRARACGRGGCRRRLRRPPARAAGGSEARSQSPLPRNGSADTWRSWCSCAHSICRLSSRGFVSRRVASWSGAACSALPYHVMMPDASEQIELAACRFVMRLNSTTHAPASSTGSVPAFAGRFLASVAPHL